MGDPSRGGLKGLREGAGGENTPQAPPRVGQVSPVVATKDVELGHSPAGLPRLLTAPPPPPVNRRVITSSPPPHAHVTIHTKRAGGRDAGRGTWSTDPEQNPPCVSSSSVERKKTRQRLRLNPSAEHALRPTPNPDSPDAATRSRLFWECRAWIRCRVSTMDYYYSRYDSCCRCSARAPVRPVPCRASLVMGQHSMIIFHTRFEITL
ncbi:hypothetical protein THAOC_07369 [Thalassiosira oceanica]|uniref:Uncharacterized protein n=1 Tax=Thalassiosira oceanica TaxID=159749 RepID=K0TKM4_THAOC|nr:hypothetical protein THAOC_07369 [Thalassiosira oceanica]|eukprot:EJK71212.1 hypothetical protein THAOC_07369 [Thalassiosira oceanica]